MVFLGVIPLDKLPLVLFVQAEIEASSRAAHRVRLTQPAHI